VTLFRCGFEYEFSISFRRLITWLSGMGLFRYLLMKC